MITHYLLTSESVALDRISWDRVVQVARQSHEYSVHADVIWKWCASDTEEPSLVRRGTPLEVATIQPPEGFTHGDSRAGRQTAGRTGGGSDGDGSSQVRVAAATH